MSWAAPRPGRTWIPPQVGAVMGGAGLGLASPRLPSWPRAPRPAEPCPKCEHPRAYFMQIQTRSADEPMTTFYKCCSPQCGHRWRD